MFLLDSNSVYNYVLAYNSNLQIYKSCLNAQRPNSILNSVMSAVKGHLTNIVTIHNQPVL
jgi:hypothetical protein